MTSHLTPVFSSAETVSLTTAASGWFCILTTSLAAQPGGVQPVFRHVQLRGATVPPVSSQLRTPASSSSSSTSSHPPAAEQGVRPGGLCREGRSVALSALLTQRPHQVERGGSLWVHPLTARSVQEAHSRRVPFRSVSLVLTCSLFLCWSTQVVRRSRTSFALRRLTDRLCSC